MPGTLSVKTIIEYFFYKGPNLRHFAKEKNVNRPNTDQSHSQQNENDQNPLWRRTRSGRKSPSRNQNKTPKTSGNQPTSTKNKQDHLLQNPPKNPTLPLPQVPPTVMDSEAAKEWKNLDNSFAYSGNTVTILDKIKSFS